MLVGRYISPTIIKYTIEVYPGTPVPLRCPHSQTNLGLHVEDYIFKIKNKAIVTHIVRVEWSCVACFAHQCPLATV